MERATKIVSEMIVQRGYTITDKNDDNIIAVNSDNKKIVFITTPVIKFNSDKTKEYVSLSRKMGISHFIIVYKDCVTPMSKKLIIQLSCDFILELFHIDELQYNITKHKLVPQHIKISDNEAKEFKKKYGLRYPTILKTDPIARFYYYQKGDIIKIVRNNGYVTYRIVKG